MSNTKYVFNREVKILKEITGIDEFLVIFLDTLEKKIINKHYIKKHKVEELYLNIKYMREKF